MKEGSRWLPREEMLCRALKDEIRLMLTELGNPQLVDVIFPDGWENTSYEKLCQLYDLCLRTHTQRLEAQP